MSSCIQQNIVIQPFVGGDVAMSLAHPGQILKHYRITDKIGRGGMGQVYRAEDTKLNRRVAIKFLSPEGLRDEKAKLRLPQEARSASALNHPNIVTIHSIDDYDGLDFIVMEYVEGETLRTIVERGAIGLPHLLEVGTQVAAARGARRCASRRCRSSRSSNWVSVNSPTRGRCWTISSGAHALSITKRFCSRASRGVAACTFCLCVGVSM